MPKGIYQHKPLSKKHRKNLSLVHKGKKLSKETKKKISESNKGKHNKLFSQQWKNKLSESHKGKCLSKETKRKISEAHKGKIFSKEHRKKLSEAQKGEKCRFWQGSIWNNPYSVDWTDDLKRAIRKRDRYTCRICNKEPTVCVHHIDYDKLNCNPNNLITLCSRCHAKTNYKRNFWIQYFKNI
jgi:hypothetical protein